MYFTRITHCTHFPSSAILLRFPLHAFFSQAAAIVQTPYLPPPSTHTSIFIGYRQPFASINPSLISSNGTIFNLPPTHLPSLSLSLKCRSIIFHLPQMATNPLLLGIASNSSLNFQIPSISIKLDRDNYSLWRSTIISALETFELEAFVLAPAPPAETITVLPTGNQRFVSGLVAADYFAAGYFVWAVLIANLARIGYEEKNMYMAAYDWRLSFQNTEVRDQSLSRMKNNIELMVATTGEKVVVIPHSIGVLYFLHFMKWVEMPPPMGGGGGSDWCSKHIKAVMNIGGPFLSIYALQ